MRCAFASLHCACLGVGLRSMHSVYLGVSVDAPGMKNSACPCMLPAFRSADVGESDVSFRLVVLLSASSKCTCPVNFHFCSMQFLIPKNRLLRAFEICNMVSIVFASVMRHNVVLTMRADGLSIMNC